MRNRQRGVGTAAKALILLAATTILLGTTYALIHYVGSWLDRRDAQSFAAGRVAALKDVADRDNATLRDREATILKLQERVDALTRDATDQIIAAQAAHEEEMDDANRKHDSTVAAVRDGLQRLCDKRVRQAGDVARAGSGGGAARDAAANPAGDRAPEGRAGGLPDDDDAAFLAGEAGRADLLVAKLNLTKRTLRAYVTFCGAELAP